MQLTDSLLALYVGGQLEIQNENEGYIFRGEIKSAQLFNGRVEIIPEWMAKGEGYPPLPIGWVVDTRIRIYEASLSIYAISNIGPSSEGGGDRICLHSSIVGETTILFPPDGNKLKRSKVKELAAA